MVANWEKNYPTLHGITLDTLGENNSLMKQALLVGENKRVLDFGCANGYLAQLLGKQGCQVVGVEINSTAAQAAQQYCEKVIVADLDFVTLSDILPNQQFDVVVLSDVLEHLRNPWKMLEEANSLLKPKGYIVASIPNIAHGAIRLALLQGAFDYAKLGILDDTHLRFFTRKTVEDLFERSGYFIDSLERTVVPVFSDCALTPPVNKLDFTDEIIRQVEQDEEATTLQFVLRAFPLSAEGKYAALEGRHSQLLEEYVALTNRNFSLQTQLKQLQLIQQHAESLEAQLQLTQQHAQTAQQHAENLEAQLQLTQQHAQNLKNQMQNSKLLQLKEKILKIKKVFV